MDKIIFEKVGARLKQARELKHITLEEAGKKVDVHKSTVLRWENGETEKIKLPIIEILASYYNVNPVWLMGYDVPMQNNISEIPSNMIMIPVYGQIAAGQPNWAIECLEGYLPIDPNLMNILNPEETFFLKVNGESMNKVIRNGAYALIRKQEIVENGEIAVVLVDNDNATLKRFSQNGQIVILSPDSDLDEFEPIPFDLKTTTIKILGKYIGKFEINN